jgi:large subunit ribosomal protein L10
MPTVQKGETIGELKSLFQNSTLTVLTEYRGMTVADITKLRRELRTSGTVYQVAKNTLLLRAANEVGFTGLDKALNGPTAVAFVGDDLAKGAKALLDYAGTSKTFVIKEALLSGQLVGTARLEAITKLDSKEKMIAKMLGSLNAPATNVALALNAVPRGLVQVLDAYRRKLEEEGGAAA